MADRRYKLLRDGLVGPRSFSKGDLTADDLPIWNPTTGTWDLIDATDLVSGETAIVPDGTVNKSTLRWSGTAWVENADLLAATGTNKLELISSDGAVNLIINSFTGSDGRIIFEENSVEDFRIFNDESSGILRFRAGAANTFLFEEGNGTYTAMSLDPQGNQVLYHAGSKVFETITGSVKFGTHSALVSETVTGYITIQDSGGVTRKLAVVS